MAVLNSLINTITSPVRMVFHWIMRCTPGLKNLPSVSLPMRIALMTFLFLLIVITTAAISYNFSDAADKVFWKWIIAALLVIVNPIIVYFLVKVSMAKDESRFPDIDRIWEAGLQECAKQGISLDNAPLFLVQGARDHRQASQLMRASTIPFPVIVPAKEESDILFFANSEAVFLYIQGCSCISRLSTAPSGPAPAPSAAGAPGGPATFTGTIDASMFDNPAAAAGSAGHAPPPDQAIGQTLTDSSMFPATGSSPQSAMPMQPAAAGVGGTMLLPQGGDAGDFVAAAAASSAGGAVPVPQLSSQDIASRNQKLRYVCSLIKKARQSLCPINGLITLLPFELIEIAAGPLQTAAQKDMAILREELLVRCSNTVLITQMDKEPGFQELINRVGEEQMREFRFGKGCELWNAPEGPRLDAVAAHAVGAFEDWIYMLFQKENALQQPHNSRLFMLLCRIRGRFAENLRAVLSRGFGFDPNTEADLAYEQFLFSGCYFAAAGADPSRQAFVKSVFLKSMQQEGELEWTPEARRRDGQLQFAANLFLLLGAASILAIILMLAASFSGYTFGQ